MADAALRRTAASSSFNPCISVSSARSSPSSPSAFNTRRRTSGLLVLRGGNQRVDGCPVAKLAQRRRGAHPYGDRFVLERVAQRRQRAGVAQALRARSTTMARVSGSASFIAATSAGTARVLFIDASVRMT